jgi:endonuclease YncB( thermonuclease family)
MRHLLALLLLVIATTATAQTVRVIDGDSLDVAGEDIRLIGIDAPEGRQLCQRNGLEWRCGTMRPPPSVSSSTAPKCAATCWATTVGAGRWAVCFAGDVELNREMVRRGWALAYYPERGAVPGPVYDAEQIEAEQAQRGLWSGSFIEPWEWRRRP